MNEYEGKYFLEKNVRLKNGEVSCIIQDYATADEAIQASYDKQVYDEFIIPCVIGDYQGMQDGDGLIMANYRSERAREITRILLQSDFEDAPRCRVVKFASAVAMTEYSLLLNCSYLLLFV